MTSGIFQTVPIDRVWVNRAERQRKEIKDVDVLADSIRRLGLIHPPVVTRDFELKAGERRLEAVRSLGWTSLPVQFVDELDPTALLLLELEENVKRLDISWQDQCAALEKYHNLRLSQNPAWTIAKTAEAVGESPNSVSVKLNVMKEVGRDPDIAKVPNFSQARGITQRRTERRAATVINEILDKPTSPVPLFNEPFSQEWIDRYSGPKFNFIHCDFPYGINQHLHNKGGTAHKAEKTYADTFENYEALVALLAKAPVAESAHLVFWFSMEHYCWTFDRLTDMGWTVNRFPLVWSKGSTGILPDPNRGPRRVYETALFASKGDRKINQAVLNHIAFWDGDRIHVSEKPREVLKHFFRMFVDDSTVMIDPTCGSGNAVWVAQKLGASHVIGLEQDKENYDAAVKAYTE